MENEIKLEEVKVIAKKLKSYSKDWAKELSLEMAKITSDKVVENTVYNIQNGVRRHQQWRRLFVNASVKLVAQYEKTQNVAAKNKTELIAQPLSV